ncbi:MAG TPA: nuclease [Verrucomicrobiae bacterium]|nr:nuclease [Verrucomicrobiae bacterium]
MLIVLVLAQSQLSFAWGNEGHTYVNRVAASKIPVGMPRFLRHAVEEIAYLGPEPDRWRSSTEFALKNAQEPDHFIDLERVEWMNPLPEGRYEFIRKLYDKRASTTDHPDDYLPEHVGFQPYITMEIYERLIVEFREYRQRQALHQSTLAVQKAIIVNCGLLGHYVADGSQPLHTTIQYNGWVGPNPKEYTTEHGIHSLFESAYVAANIHPEDFAAFVEPPEKLNDPFAQYLDYLRKSHSLVQDVYAIEKAGGFTAKGSRAAFDFTTQRLAAGSQMLLDLWYTAWLKSAVPLPEHPSASGK